MEISVVREEHLLAAGVSRKSEESRKRVRIEE